MNVSVTIYYIPSPEHNYYKQIIFSQPQDTAGKSNWRVLCSLWCLHPHPAHTDSCQQLRRLLQEQTVEERGGAQEEGAHHAAGSRAQSRPEVPPDPGEVLQ